MKKYFVLAVAALFLLGCASQQSCADLNGQACDSAQVCSGELTRTIDTNYCCLGSCREQKSLSTVTPFEQPTSTTQPTIIPTIPVTPTSPTPIKQPSPTPSAYCEISVDRSSPRAPATVDVGVRFFNLDEDYDSTEVDCGSGIIRYAEIRSSGKATVKCDYPARADTYRYTLKARAGPASCEYELKVLKTEPITTQVFFPSGSGQANIDEDVLTCETAFDCFDAVAELSCDWYP
ncbi:MAG: hypothetical protein V1834_00055, partial [Candidatus Micrarchaeota archaeon]